VRVILVRENPCAALEESDAEVAFNGSPYRISYVFTAVAVARHRIEVAYQVLG
jgi:hypothetical protein